MRTKRKTIHSALDVELYKIFKEQYPGEDSYDDAVREAKKAFTYVRRDVLYRNLYFDNEQ